MLTVNLERLDIQDHHSVLDLGCGEGRHAIGVNYIKPHANIYAIDLNLPDLEKAKEKHKAFNPNNHTLYIHGDAFSLPFADESFDHIICSEVLEHIEDYQAVLSEIQRILKPNGQLCVSVPRKWPEVICWKLSREYYNVDGGHVRIFNSARLKESIQVLNFEYRHRHWAHALHVPYWWLRCFFWQKDENKQHVLVRIYHRFLVWDMMEKPWITKQLEYILNPVLGKSTVLYFQKKSKS